jgi:hypothetical protein
MLAVIVERNLDIEHILGMKQIKLTTFTFGLLLSAAMKTLKVVLLHKR